MLSILENIKGNERASKGIKGHQRTSEDIRECQGMTWKEEGVSEVQFNAEQPIYIQIGKDIQEQTISGRLGPGEKLHSVREYSVLYEVSPLTIHRAMQYLEREGVIYSQKGVGSFVKEDIREELEGTMLDAEILEFIGRLRKCGLSDSEILDRIEKLLSDEG